jgi:arsenate reductase
MEPVVYAYSGCGTCRKALQWLEGRKIQPKVLAIRETPPSKQDLKKALEQVGSLKALFNVSGGDYKELGLKDRLSELTVEDALDLLASRGNLVKRPFVRAGSRYLVGFREDQWEEVFP